MCWSLTVGQQRAQLGLADAALLCLRHHRRFDNGPWKLTVVTKVTFHRTDRTTQPDRPGNTDPSDRAP